MSATALRIVCAWCERVRTSAGCWVEPEIVDGYPPEPTHGICPECLAAEKRAAVVSVECQ